MSAFGPIDASTMVRARGIAAGFYAAGMDRDDLVQEALLGAWQARLRFRAGAGASFRTFEHECMRRRVLDAVTRARRVKRGVGAVESELTDTHKALGGPESVQELHDVMAAVRELPVHEQRALVLLAAGFSYQEIAGAEGVTAKRVDNTLFDARAALRRRLAA